MEYQVRKTATSSLRLGKLPVVILLLACLCLGFLSGCGSDESPSIISSRQEAVKVKLDCGPASDSSDAAASGTSSDAREILSNDGGKLQNPLKGSTVSSPFGPRSLDDHKGIDLSAPEGTPYVAAEDGTVIYAYYDCSKGDMGCNGGAGNWIVIDHGNNLVTKYMHSVKVFVKEGDKVKRGEKIGLVGETGQAFGAHLHFQVEESGTPVDPEKYINTSGGGSLAPVESTSSSSSSTSSSSSASSSSSSSASGTKPGVYLASAALALACRVPQLPP